MPTVPQLKAELKQLGVKGYSGKLKGELMYMLVAAKKAKEEVKKPEPIKIAIKDIRAKRAKAKQEEQEERYAKNAADHIEWKRERIKNNEEVIEELQKVVAETNEASKEGGKYKRRDNWKGKAKYYKMITALYHKYTGSKDYFNRYLKPFELSSDWHDWAIKQQDAEK